MMPAGKPLSLEGESFQYLLNYFMSCHYTEVIKRKKKERDAVIKRV